MPKKITMLAACELQGRQWGKVAVAGGVFLLAAGAIAVFGQSGTTDPAAATQDHGLVLRPRTRHRGNGGGGAPSRTGRPGGREWFAAPGRGGSG